MLFFFSCYCAPRDLHSFPTRRSSDLGDGRCADRGASGVVDDELRHRRADELQSGDWGRDRKSTRLNSSHTVISYAVFCLKKKKLTRASGGRLYAVTAASEAISTSPTP